LPFSTYQPPEIPVRVDVEVSSSDTSREKSRPTTSCGKPQPDHHESLERTKIEYRQRDILAPRPATAMSDSMKQRARHSTPHWFRSSDDTPQFDNKALRWSSDEWRQQPCFLQKARKEQSRGFQALNDPSWLKIKRNVSLGIEPPTVGRVVNPQEPLHKVMIDNPPTVQTESFETEPSGHVDSQPSTFGRFRSRFLIRRSRSGMHWQESKVLDGWLAHTSTRTTTGWALAGDSLLMSLARCPHSKGVIDRHILLAHIEHAQRKNWCNENVSCQLKFRTQG